MLKKYVMLILVLGVDSACTTVPTGPSVMVLSGAGKPFDQFQLADQHRGGSGHHGSLAMPGTPWNNKRSIGSML